MAGADVGQGQGQGQGGQPMQPRPPPGPRYHGSPRVTPRSSPMVQRRMPGSPALADRGIPPPSPGLERRRLAQLQQQPQPLPPGSPRGSRRGSVQDDQFLGEQDLFSQIQRLEGVIQQQHQQIGTLTDKAEQAGQQLVVEAAKRDAADAHQKVVDEANARAQQAEAELKAKQDEFAARLADQKAASEAQVADALTKATTLQAEYENATTTLKGIIEGVTAQFAASNMERDRLNGELASAKAQLAYASAGAAGAEQTRAELQPQIDAQTAKVRVVILRWPFYFILLGSARFGLRLLSFILTHSTRTRINVV